MFAHLGLFVCICVYRFQACWGFVLNNEMLRWTRRCPVQMRCRRGNHSAVMRERRSKLSFGWWSLAGWSHTYRQQKTGVLHRRSRINLIPSSIIILLYPQHVRPYVHSYICWVPRSLYSSKPWVMQAVAGLHLIDHMLQTGSEVPK